MALYRYTRPVDGTIPVQALLYNDEELLASQEGVGVYNGLQKSPAHQSGTVHVTTHRLFYIDRKRTRNSFALDLGYVTQTEYYAGLFKSSPKVTLHLASSATSSTSNPSSSFNPSTSSTWECDVCAYRNPPGLSPAAARICGLCGVPRGSVPSSSSASSTPPSAPSPLSAATITMHHDPEEGIPCPACTFLNHPSLRTCEICGGSLPRPARRRQHSTAASKSAPSSRPGSLYNSDLDADDDEDGEEDGEEEGGGRGEGGEVGMIKISFRKGGDKPFYNVLKRSLKGKGWEIKGYTSRTQTGNSSEPERNTIGRSGISGILRTVETSAQGRESNMKDALSDLEALMVKAGDMVRLAAELNERLTAMSSSAAGTVSSAYSAPGRTGLPEPEEATFIRSSLSQLGLQMTNAPVTLDMMKDERKWYEGLARELAGVLQGSNDGRGKEAAGMMKHRGIIALDEVWGGWNRARGVALIPPQTFLLTLPLLPAHTSPPINQRTFASGLSVLHTPPYTAAAFASRLSGLITLSGPMTTMGISEEERLTVALAGEMVAAVETDGGVCRDDAGCFITGGGVGFGGGEVRWWLNVFSGYVWDGQE
ncbi:EAP30/Vps36 family-domain-containing protein [Crucibulum laeve]|uniref:Vacuolar protein-sorting-associated protein 36 n=1 Tax=Crucibulum laeve TaxID=68775 RepID=A0A5C3LLZ9_9AGAR|nr:EAP30/Vps36 family-domain-containing protein [Crucibulum laeve]